MQWRQQKYTERPAQSDWWRAVATSTVIPHTGSISSCRVATASAGSPARRPDAFSWTILFHHNSHTHPLVGPITNVRSGTFVIPTIGETSANVWYRVYLTLTDASGLRTTLTRDVLPLKSTFRLETDPPGFGLTLDGQPVATPQAVTGVVGIERTLGAPLQQTVGGRLYGFVSWSDGGAATHTISTPAANTTYLATYREVQGGTGDADVTTSTTGADLDPDGYTIVGDETVFRPTGVNATVRFSGVPAGDHVARLAGVASNCTVSGPNPQTATVVAGAVITVRFTVSCATAPPPPPPPPPTRTRVTGLGAFGSGPATPGGDRRTFDFDVTDTPGGRLRATDWSIVRSNGGVASATLDPTTDPATAITSFTRTSTVCATFGGTARLDTGELVGIAIDACDNASPGTGRDSFTIRVPSLGYMSSGTLTEGDIALSTSSTQP